MEHIVELHDVCKEYYRSRKENVEVLHNINLTLDRGEVFGLIGPNGAGKTTLIRIMCGLVRPTRGSVKVLGTELTGKDARLPTGIGVVVENPSFIPDLTGRENLRLLASIRGIIGDSEIDATLRLVGLDPNNKIPAGKYSLGMRQRLGLAQAIMEKPKLLLLDEPTNGLDPKGIIELRNLIRHIAEQGTAVFLASHLLYEVEQVCDKIAIIQKGRILREMRKIDPVPYRGFHIQVSSEKDWLIVEQWVNRHKADLSKENEVFEGKVETAIPVPTVVRELVQEGVNIESIIPDKDTLESTFLQVIAEEL